MSFLKLQCGLKGTHKEDTSTTIPATTPTTTPTTTSTTTPTTTPTTIPATTPTTTPTGTSVHSPEQQKSEQLDADCLAYGMDAYKHYQLYVQIERNIEIQKLEESKKEAMEKIMDQIEEIDVMMSKAKAYYKNPSQDTALEWRELRRDIKKDSKTTVKSHTHLGHKLTQLHEHKPIFTSFIIFAQLVSCAVIYGLGGFTKIGFEPQLELMNGVQTFLGTETVHKWIIPNVWIGPTEKYLISVGALFAPCMREDFGIQIDLAKMNYSIKEPLGCCEMPRRNEAGTTTEEECRTLTHGAGRWRHEYTCGKRPSGQNSVAHTLKPCCVGTKSICMMLTFSHCTFLDGTFHQFDQENCREVNCLSNICSPGEIESQTEKPWISRSPKQLWRLPLSLLYHHGIIHTLLVVIVQFFLLSQIERTIGWLRVMIVYILTGSGGLMVAALFDPYSPHVGGTGALFGLVGLIFVELLYFWKYIHQRKSELFKILIVLIFFLFSGTLPYINNFTIVSGFVLGVLCAFVLLPYIGLNNTHDRCRMVVVALIVPLILLSFFMVFYTFYKVQTFDSCEICKKLNCVSYTDNMCQKNIL